MLLVIAGCGDTGTTGVIVAAGPGTVHVAGRRPAPPPRPASTAPVTRLVAARHHACTLHADGAVACWGENVEGQLGDEATSRAVGLGRKRMVRPAPVGAPIADALELAAGGERTCVRRKDGVWCWGGGSLAPEHIAGVDDAVEITARCARTGKGEVLCWHDVLAADLEPRWIGVIDIAGAEDRTCVVRGGGAVTCWGFATPSSAETQVIPGAIEVATSRERTCVRTAEGEVWCWWPGNEVSQVRNVEHAAQVVIGATYACELERTGEVRCWGRAPDAVAVERAYAEAVPGVEAEELAAGDDFMCARTGADVRCWGENDHGQLGTGWSKLHPAPIAVPGIDDAIDVHAGAGFTCARRRNTNVACWGSGHFVDGPEPSDVTDMAGAIQLAGTRDLCARFAGGDARCKAYGPARDVAVNTTDLAIAEDHGIAVVADGGLIGWGDAASGAIGMQGHGPGRLAERRSDAEPAAEVVDAVAVGASQGLSCFIRRDRTVACLGHRPGAAISFLPIAVPGVEDAIALALGRQFACALIAGGTVRCWGENEHGALGFAAKRSAEHAAAVRLDRVVQIAAATGAICARRDDGTVWCWGDNETGILGEPFELPWSAEPVQIRVSDAVDISVADQACAVLESGAVMCWGLAENGEVGTVKSKSLGPSRVRFNR